jgi:hypothetical protein
MTTADTVVVNANVTITATALQAIVANAKKNAPRNEKGYYLVDTADKVSEMISRFLLENDFEGFAGDPGNYSSS